IWDYDLSQPSDPLYPTAMAPGVRDALGGCVDSEGNLPNSPIEYDMRVVTEEDASVPWIAGETRTLCFQLRSSSLKWVLSPPQIQLILIGGNGNDSIWMDLGYPTSAQDGTSNTFFVREHNFIVPEIPSGRYKFFAFEKSTGLCRESEFAFTVKGADETPTPTPTGTAGGGPTPTPTPTEGSGGETPTPTPTIGPPPYAGNMFLSDVGPGTKGPGIPSTHLKIFTCPADPGPLPSGMSPGIRHALGFCRVENGNLPNSPVEYDVKLLLDDGFYHREIPTWERGSQHWVHLVARSSSIRFVETPPEFHLYMVGPSGVRIPIQEVNSPSHSTCTTYQVHDDPVLIIVAEDVEGGLYRIHGFDDAVGLCVASEQSFYIPPSSGGGPTPTPTRRMPDYNNNHFVDGVDAPGFLARLAMRNEEANIDGMEGTSFRDMFMFALWWHRSELDN
ncbi:MAG: hypothetical protein KC940_18155, partial [Candidatus Omnitrophica bacterium]|nr:hypothetical protein [Candidatus Omnitrophota bacterium]